MLKQLISKDVLEYMEKTGFRFSDADTATIIFQAELPTPEKLRLLSELGEKTEDTILRQQINERIAYEQLCYRRFQENDGSCFYELSAAESSEDFEANDVMGHFCSVDLAIKHAKWFEIPFYIKKYQIIGLCENIVVPYIRPNPHLFCEDMTIKCNYFGDDIAGCDYDAQGNPLCCWSFEIPEEEKKTIDWGYGRFEWRFIEFPNPFDLGDIVRVVGSDIIGVVSTSQKMWHEYLHRIKERSLMVDFSDASLVVEYLPEEGEVSHIHIQPVYLEKVEVDEETRKHLHALIDKED